MSHILVVDDAATVRMYHRSILESAGHTVEEAMTGVEALEKALQNSFDLYVVDVNMPKMNGFEFLRRIRQEAMAQVPALMVSTEAASRDEIESYRSGANSYLCKPVRSEALLTQALILLGGQL